MHEVKYVRGHYMQLNKKAIKMGLHDIHKIKGNDNALIEIKRPEIKMKGNDKGWEWN